MYLRLHSFSVSPDIIWNCFSNNQESAGHPLTVAVGAEGSEEGRIEDALKEGIDWVQWWIGQLVITTHSGDETLTKFLASYSLTRGFSPLLKKKDAKFTRIQREREKKSWNVVDAGAGGGSFWREVGPEWRGVLIRQRRRHGSLRQKGKRILSTDKKKEGRQSGERNSCIHVSPESGRMGGMEREKKLPEFSPEWKIFLSLSFRCV